MFHSLNDNINVWKKIIEYCEITSWDRILARKYEHKSTFTLLMLKPVCKDFLKLCYLLIKPLYDYIITLYKYDRFRDPSLCEKQGITNFRC